MRPHEAAKCAATIQAAYSRPQMTDATAATYERLLVDLDFVDAMAAIDRHILTNKWLPTVAEIRAECTRAVSTLPEPEIAWGEVRRKIGSHGRNIREDKPLNFSAPEIRAAVDVIGWQTICNDPNEMSTRSRFVDAYRSYYDGSVRVARLGVHAPQRRLGPPVEANRLGPAKSADDEPPDRGGGMSPWVRLLEKYEPMIDDDDKPEGVF